jgi:hypothetical protein
MSDSLRAAVRAATLAQEAGWPEPLVRLAVALTMAESKGDPAAVGDRSIAGGIWGPSYGLMQLRSMPAQRGTGLPRDADRIVDPLENMKAALELYHGGRFTANGQNWYEPGGLGQWSTFKNKTYEPFMDLAEQAVRYADFNRENIR